MEVSNVSAEMSSVYGGLEIRKKRENDIVVALAGNPNVGKSTVFNAMTGLRQHTGNWAGKTVSNAQGYAAYGQQGYVMVDIPGCYSLHTHSAEEEAAREFICSGAADVVAVVCDAVCLERNMGLALQIMELTDNVVICVNLMDEAAKKRIRIDLKGLQDRLGVPVIGTSAREGIGIEGLYQAINAAAARQKSDSREYCCPQGADRAGELCRGLITYEDSGYMTADRKKDKLFTGKLTAVPIMFLLLLGTFWLTIIGANYPSELLRRFFSFLEGKLMGGLVRAGAPALFREMLVYGVYRVVAWIAAVMLPPMAIFFPLFTIMEDSGYLPRVAFNLDKCFRKCNACGKQSLTMCMGFGCNAAGVTGCRIIDSPRERLIAIITNSFVPCNGRFPTLMAIIAMFFIGGEAGIGNSFLSALVLAGFIILGIGMTFFVSWLLSVTMLKGMPSFFALELPPYRRPQIGRIAVRSVCDRTIFVLARAMAAAAPAGLIIWLMANVRVHDVTVLSYLADALNPLARMMGLDGVILLAFILGMPANEIVVPIIIMAYLSRGTLTDISDYNILKQLLTENGWTWVTAVSTMLFSLFHWPCATTCMTIRKETGSLKWTLAAILIPTLLGVTACMLFCFAANHLHL